MPLIVRLLIILVTVRWRLDRPGHPWVCGRKSNPQEGPSFSFLLAMKLDETFLNNKMKCFKILNIFRQEYWE